MTRRPVSAAFASQASLMPPTARPRRLSSFSRRAAVVAGALLALTGCAAQDFTPDPGDGTMVHSAIIDPRYAPREIGAFGPFPVEVIGRPPDGATAQEVAAGMRMPARFGGDPLAVAEGPALTSGPRIVVIFRPSSRLDFCSSPQGAEEPGLGGDLVAGLAYCWGDSEMTSALMRSGATAGPRDAGFTPAMRTALGILLPARGPNDGSRRRFRPPGS